VQRTVSVPGVRVAAAVPPSLGWVGGTWFSRITSTVPMMALWTALVEARPFRQFRNGTRHAASDKTKDYLVFGSLMLRNWRVASTTDFSIGNRSADEPPT
jgi:hypothetical protein